MSDEEKKDRATLRKAIRKACRHYMQRWPNRTRSLEALLIRLLGECTSTADHELIDALSEIRRDEHGYHL
jgi:RNase P protein component